MNSKYCRGKRVAIIETIINSELAVLCGPYWSHVHCVVQLIIECSLIKYNVDTSVIDHTSTHIQ